MRQAPRLPALVFGAKGLGGILDNKQTVFSSDGIDPVIIGRKSEQVHRDDASGFEDLLLIVAGYRRSGQRIPRGIACLKCQNGLLQMLRADIEASGVDLDKDRGRSQETDDLSRCDEGERGREDGIARADIMRHEGHEQSVGA